MTVTAKKEIEIIQKELQNLHRELILVVGEMNEFEKTFSRVQNESEKLIQRLEKLLKHSE